MISNKDQIECLKNEKTVGILNLNEKFKLSANRTIYVNNLNEKIPLSELKEALHELFSKFGEIRIIKCFKSFYRRGQAWISFNQLDSAEKALTANGIYLFSKPIRVSFALEESKIIDLEDKRTDKTPVIPKSINNRIKLYKLYLHQWLKHIKDNGLLDNMLEFSKNRKEGMHYNPVLWDTNVFRKADFLSSSIGNQISSISKVNQEYMHNKRKLDYSIDNFPNKSNKLLNKTDVQNQNNILFVQIIGSCSEEELHDVFRNINGYKELRFVQVS